MDIENREAQTQRTLYDTLVTYSDSDFYPYHMPGHKRNRNICPAPDSLQLDITEIDGFDNLHQPEGILQEAQERAAALYGSEESFFLINGSTCGILAAVMSVTDKGDVILIARNCHKSVYNSAFLQELNLHYLFPRQIEEYDISDAIDPADVEAALELYPECKAVAVTSPTYEGVISDIARIAQIVHSKGKILIVDEAHGAHLGLAEGMPDNSVSQGADIVIHSLHKTLPSMTQTAVLHVNGPLVDRGKLRRYLSIFQSSSPSYVLMAGMDACISYIHAEASSAFGRLIRYRCSFVERMKECRHIRIAGAEFPKTDKYCFAAWDICKLVISVKGTSMSGQQLYDILRDEFHLQMEMAAGSYVLAIMTISDEEEGWKRLSDALLRIDDRIEGVDVGDEELCPVSRPETAVSIARALGASNKKEVLLEHAAGEISGDFINLYPPGIPILVPGEVFNESILAHIRGYLKLGHKVQGVSERGTVTVL